MNFETFVFSVIAFILLVTKEIKSSRQKASDLKPIRSRYADLLNSLVNINVDRVDALKKLLKLYDFKRVKYLLRGPDDEEDAKTDESGKYPKINELIGYANNNRLCTCREKNTHQLYNSDDFADYIKSEENSYSAENLHDNPESGRVILIDKQLSNARNNPTSDSMSEQHFSKDLKVLARSKRCISHHRGYENCKSACKEAYRRVCAKYKCGESFHDYFRKQYRRTCRSIFLDDDYDYD